MVEIRCLHLAFQISRELAEYIGLVGSILASCSELDVFPCRGKTLAHLAWCRERFVKSASERIDVSGIFTRNGGVVDVEVEHELYASVLTCESVEARISGVGSPPLLAKPFIQFITPALSSLLEAI